MEEFEYLAPEGSRTEEVLADEHQLMLNRLAFELAERQRYSLFLNHVFIVLITALCRLDLKKRELIQQKEELLKESKAKSSTMDSVKTQIELLMKVCISPLISVS